MTTCLYLPLVIASGPQIPAGHAWTSYYYVNGQRVAMRVKSNQDGVEEGVYYFLTDHLGSTSITLDEGANQVAELRYSAWGETRYTDGDTPTQRRYTGQLEAEAGLYFYNARWFDPGLGRFAQADTFVPQPSNPLAWDRYGYSRNNPVNYNDPTGHLQKEADDGGLDPIAVVRHLNDEYDWNMVGDWNIKQLLATWDAAIELRLYVGNVRGEDGTGWMRKYFGGTNFSKSTFGPFSNGTCMGIDNKNVILAEDFESKWAYEGGTAGLIIHELGHVLDNRIGLNIDFLKAGALPYPAVMIGGGPADSLYMLLGGNISESQAFKRYAGGVSFANDPIRSFRAPYQYGNNSPADYFAHTLAVSVVDQASVPFMASLWMSSFIYLLP